MTQTEFYLLGNQFNAPYGKIGELKNLKFVENRYICFLGRLSFKKQFEFNEGCRAQK